MTLKESFLQKRSQESQKLKKSLTEMSDEEFVRRLEVVLNYIKTSEKLWESFFPILDQALDRGFHDLSKEEYDALIEKFYANEQLILMKFEINNSLGKQIRREYPHFGQAGTERITPE